LFWAEIVPRIGSKPPVDVLGLGFTYCIANTDGGLRVFIRSSVSPETLSRFFGVSRASPEDILGVFGGEVYVAEARLKRSRDFWWSSFSLLDLPGIAGYLPSRAAICISFSRDPGLSAIFRSRAGSLARRALRYGRQDMRMEAREMLSRAGKALLACLWVLAGDRDALKKAVEIAESGSSVELSWSVRRVRRAGDLEEILAPRGIGLWERLFGDRRRLVSDEQGYRSSMSFPDPSIHRIGFVRGYPLPMLAPNRAGERSFRIGVLDDGREYRLSVEDLYRHVYIIGQTGSGKTSLLKLLVHMLRRAGGSAIIVIDPHGDMSKELAEEIPESIYLHPFRSPFGLNPLDLPRHVDRDFAVTVAIDILIEIFREVLRLMETAVNVKYLLQVLLRAFYSRTDSPTLSMLYRAILALYRGELDLEVDDPEWDAQLEALRRMQDQTFISALSRLEPYAHDRLLARLTSRTTIDFGKMLSPGSITIFAVPKADLGEAMARLIASTIVMKIWFEVLARARMGVERTPVFLVIDEFHFVSDLPIIDTILSEARKYGLHLIVAHQHTDQIPGRLLQSVMSNCAVKIAFQVGGGDVKRLSTMDAGFAESLAKALTGLAIGRAVVKLTAGPGEQQPPPVVVSLDRVVHEERRREIYTMQYDPGEPAKEDLRGLLNPVLKYIDPVKPLEFMALYTLYREKSLGIGDLAARLGARREELEKALNTLAGRGFIEIQRDGNRRVARYVRGLFKDLRRVAPSDDGYRLARRVLIKYAGRGYVVSPARQDPSLPSRPDLVAIPVDRSTWRPIYSKAVAIEIESCSEVETHPDQVSRNWVKESTRDFAEIHSWTWDRCFKRLEEIYGIASIDRGRVRIFSAGEPVKRGKEVQTSLGSAGERVFTAVDGRRYRASFESQRDLELFDRICSEGSARVSNGSVECRPRGYTTWIPVRVSSLDALG